MERRVLLLFVALLLGSVVFHFPMIYALVGGWILFTLYERSLKRSFSQIFQGQWKAVRKVKSLLVVFLWIGVLTGLWRVSGTLAYLVYESAKILVPQAFYVLTFLITAGISFMIGTSVGTASTAGVVCMTLGRTLSLPAAPLAGAVLSGIFVGDRSSYMSTSALLVGEITGTDVRDNVPKMIKDALVPLLLTVGAYFLFQGRFPATGGGTEDLSFLQEEFAFHPLLVVPGIMMILLPLLKVSVTRTIALSSGLSFFFALGFQGRTLSELGNVILFGYTPAGTGAAEMLRGGGISSVLNMTAVILISSTYFSTFADTPLVDGIKDKVRKLKDGIGVFPATALTATAMSMISCNQTLATLLTYEMVREFIPNKEELMLYLENTSIVLPALVPWNIACAIPLTMLGGPPSSVIFACYPYLLVLWTLLRKGLFQR